MPLPKVPAEITEAGWKKACGAAYDELEKQIKLDSVLALLAACVSDKDLKVLEDLESAIKSKAGGEIQTLYQKTGNVLDRIEKLARNAKEHEKLCKEFATDLKKNPKTKAAGEWLAKSGPAAVGYAEALEAHAEDLLEKAEQVPLEKIVDLDWDLNDWDLTHLLTKVLGIKLDSIQLPEQKPVTVSVTGKAGASAAKNATLRAEFFEAAYAAGKAAAKPLKAELEDIDERFNSGAIKGNDVPKLMESAFKSFETVYAKKADEAIQKIWTELGKDQEEYRSYKIKTAVSIGAKVGGIAVGVVSIAAAGWTGAGTVLGLIALVKSTIELARKIADAVEEAREMARRIAAELEEVKASFLKDSKAVIGSKEVAKEVLVRLSGIQLNTVKSLGDTLKLFKSKLQGCNVNATAMGSDIDAALKEADALLRKLAKAESDLKGLKGVNIGKLRTKHEQLMAEVGKIVAAAAGFKQDYRDGRVKLAIWEKQVKELEGEVPDVAQKVIKWVVPLVDFAYVTDAEGAISKGASLVREYVVAATETEDQLQQANEVGDLACDVSSLVTSLIGK